jgi:polyphosphate kinase
MKQLLTAGGTPQHRDLGLGTSNSSFPFPFLDRDLSLIEFHRRVLEEARDEANPLLERVKFLSIVGTIVDEFYVTRYAELVGKTRSAHLERIDTEIGSLLSEARAYLRDQLAPALRGEGIHLVAYGELQPKERAEVESYFAHSVMPLLMPLGFDAARPFPHITGRTNALAVIVRHAGEERFACVQVPEAVPGLVPFHWRQGQATLEQGFIWLDEVVSENLAALFPGADVVEVHPFRVYRNAGLDIAVEPEAIPLRDAVEQGLRQREFGDVLAITVDEKMPSWIVELLSRHLGITGAAIHKSGDLTNLAGLVELSRLERPDLHDPPLTHRGSRLTHASEGGPRLVDRDMFASIRQGDILLHHPYESFDPVIDFVEEAASDPDVLAISTTLYRAGRNSPIVEALLKARRAGKQVRVVIELRARFDEANNIVWGGALENAGAHVVYGLLDLKVHAKMTLIVRREAGQLRRYVHLSSGNYNPATSNVYTDLGLFSCHESVGSDATQLFNLLTGYGSPSGFDSLLVAPLGLRTGLEHLIEREIGWANLGQPAHMVLKMNALADDEIVENFYRASRAGVRIDLIVRGICTLRPGVAGLSDNIRVLSIVGRFLEHSRAWYFRNGGSEEVYVGSADLMARNLDQRIEVMVRLDDVQLKQRVHREILATYLADNVKGRELMPDGRYTRVARRENDAAVNSQEQLL